MSLVLCFSAAGAQYQPPPPPLTSAPCVPTRKDPCTPLPTAPTTPSTGERFPFPGETPTSAPTGAVPAAPSPASNGTPGGSSSAVPTSAADAPAQGSSSSSSSEATGSSANDASGAQDSRPSAQPDNESPRRAKTSAGRRHLPKVEDMDRRESTDIEVAHYYVTTGNFQGAYLRAKDAVAIYPSDPEAHLALAETALRLKKKEEAMAEYKQVLTLDPDNEKAKAAEKALSHASFK